MIRPASQSQHTRRSPTNLVRDGSRAGLRRRTHLVRKYLWPLLSHGSRARWSNLLRTEWHLRLGHAALSSIPPVVALDPTNACPLGCPLCPTGQGLRARPVGYMAFGLFRSIVDEIATRSYKIILHNWGEPLLHPQIADMVAYASSKGLATELSTNLNVLAHGLSADLVKAHLQRLTVSIDGATESSYQRYRRGGHLSTVLANIGRIAAAKKRLHSSEPLIEVQTLVTRHNEDELGTVARRAQRAGADRMECGFLVVNLLDQHQAIEWLPTRSEYSRYDPSHSYDRFNLPNRRCSWLWRSLVVNWDGTVYPCCNFERADAQVGDVNKSDLRGLWNSSSYQELRRLFSEKRLDIPAGPLPAGTRICAWCAGVPRAQSATQQGVY